MVYLIGDRRQMRLLPSSIEDYVSQCDLTCTYDAFAESLGFGSFGNLINQKKDRQPRVQYQVNA